MMYYWTIVGYEEKNKTGMRHIYGYERDCLEICKRLSRCGWFELSYNAGIIDESGIVDDWHKFRKEK